MKMFNMPKLQTIMVIVIGIFLILAVYLMFSKLVFGPLKMILPVVFFILISSLFIIQLFSKTDKQEDKLGKSFLALTYIALPLSLAAMVGHNNNQLIMAIFILIWISDTMAYLVGCKFGKHKLFERISPKKSWEGAIGGFAFTIIIAAFGGYLFPALGFPVWKWCVIGAVVNIFGIIGDLTESMFKRSAGVKDSGNIIPGHGGLLDRLDSFIFAVPWCIITLVIIKALQ